MVCLKNKPPKVQLVISSRISHLNTVLLPGSPKVSYYTQIWYIEEYDLCSGNMVLISGCKSQKMCQFAAFLHTGCNKGNFGLVETSTLIVLANIPTHMDLKCPTCSLHCTVETRLTRHSLVHSHAHTWTILTMLRSWPYFFGQEECWWLWGGLRLWPALAAFGSSSTDPKEAPEMSPNHSTHHTPSSGWGGERARMWNVWKMYINLHLCICVQIFSSDCCYSWRKVLRGVYVWHTTYNPCASQDQSQDQGCTDRQRERE